MMRIIGWPVGLAAAFLATCAQAQTGQFWQTANWQLAAGVDYSVGRYGASSDTTVLSVPLTARVQLDRLRLDATIPYLHVKGPGAFSGGIVVGGTGATSTRSGLGDLNVGAAWLLSKDSTASPALEFEGRVKVPTAASGLGTGKFDYTAQANIYHSFTPSLMLFGSIGYQWLSDFKTYTLENGVLASGGVNFKPGGNTDLGVSVNYRQEYYRGLGNMFNISPYLLVNLGRNWRVSAYGIIGASKASPRYGAGMRLIISG